MSDVWSTRFGITACVLGAVVLASTPLVLLLPAVCWGLATMPLGFGAVLIWAGVQDLRSLRQSRARVLVALDQLDADRVHR